MDKQIHVKQISTAPIRIVLIHVFFINIKKFIVFHIVTWKLQPHWTVFQLRDFYEFCLYSTDFKGKVKLTLHLRLLSLAPQNGSALQAHRHVDNIWIKNQNSNKKVQNRINKWLYVKLNWSQLLVLLRLAFKLQEWKKYFQNLIY